MDITKTAAELWDKAGLAPIFKASETASPDVLLPLGEHTASESTGTNELPGLSPTASSVPVDDAAQSSGPMTDVGDHHQLLTLEDPTVDESDVSDTIESLAEHIKAQVAESKAPRAQGMTLSELMERSRKGGE